MDNAELLKIFENDEWQYCGKNRGRDFTTKRGIFQGTEASEPKPCQCGVIWSKTNDCPIAEVTRGEWGDSYPSFRFIDADDRVVDHYILGSKVEPYMEKIVYGSLDKKYSQAVVELIAKAPELLRENEKLKEELKNQIDDYINLHTKFVEISRIVNRIG